MAKSTLVTLPMVLLLLDYWPLARLAPATAAQELGRFPPVTFEKDRERSSTLPQPDFGHLLPEGEESGLRRFGGLVFEKLPLLALSAASCAVTFLVQRAAGTTPDWQELGPWNRVATAASGYVQYLVHMVRFDRLAVFYPLRVDIPLWKAAASLTVLAVVTVAAIRFRRRYPWLAVGWFWYLGTLVPMIGLVQVGGQSMADRYSYFSTIGLLLMLCWSLPERLAASTAGRIVLATAAAGAIAVLVFFTERQIRVWQDSTTLFEHALAVTEDNWLAHDNLGVELARRGQPAAAVEHYRQVLAIRPNYADGHYKLANGLSALGNVPEAIVHYQKAVALRPNHARARNNYGKALTQAGQRKAAIEQFERAIALDGDYYLAHYNLAIALEGEGKEAAAIEHFRAALKLRPDHAGSHSRLGALLYRRGEFAEGLKHLRRAVQLAPGNAAARAALRQATGEQGGRK